MNPGGGDDLDGKNPFSPDSSGGFSDGTSIFGSVSPSLSAPDEPVAPPIMSSPDGPTASSPVSAPTPTDPSLANAPAPTAPVPITPTPTASVPATSAPAAPAPMPPTPTVPTSIAPAPTDTPTPFAPAPMPPAEDDANMPQQGFFASNPPGGFNRRETPEFFSRALRERQIQAEDAAYASQNRRKNKKLLLVGGILAVVLVVALVALPLLLSGKKDDQTVDAKLAKAFNAYANFVLNGEDSDNPVTEEFSISKKYYFTKQIETADTTTQFFKDLAPKRDRLLTALNKRGEEINDIPSERTVFEKMHEIIDTQNMMAVVFQKPIPDFDWIKEQYVTTGATQTRQTVQGYYPDDQMVGPTAQNAKTAFVDFGLTAVDFLENNQTSPCLQRKFSGSCFEEETKTMKDDVRIEAWDICMEKAEYFKGSAYLDRFFLQRIFTINEEISGNKRE